MMELKNPIKMSKIGKRMNPSIPLVMRIIILFDWRMEPSSCFIKHKDFHPNFHRREKSFSILIDSWRMRGPLIGGKDFKTSIGQGEQAQGRSKRCTKVREEYLVFWGKKKEENENVKRRLAFYVRKGVVQKKRCVQTRAWKEVVCSKYLKWSSWKDYHDKISGFLFKIVVPLQSTVGFVSNLKQF